MAYVASCWDALAHLSGLMPGLKYMEIGVGAGDSARVVIHHGDPRELVLFDNWGAEYGGRGYGSEQPVSELLKPYKGTQITFVNGDSKDTVPKYPDEDFDLIFVDGDHSFAGCWADMSNAWPKLKVQGFMVIDDMNLHPELRDCVQKFLRETPGCGLVDMVLSKVNGHAVITKVGQ